MKESEVFIGSGNVFADLGSPNPEERQLKAHLSIKLEEAIASKNLTHRQASQKIGLTQEDLEKVIEGELSDFSVGQLIEFLNCLDREVTLSAVVQERKPTITSRIRKKDQEAANV